MNSFELFEAIGELPPETVQIKEAASPRRRIVTSIAAAIAVVLALQITVWIIEANNRPTPPGPTCGTPGGLGSADGVESDSAAWLPESEGNFPGDDTTDESTAPPSPAGEEISADGDGGVIEKYRGKTTEEVYKSLMQLPTAKFKREVKAAFWELEEMGDTGEGGIAFAVALSERINEYTEEEVLSLIVDRENDLTFRVTLVQIYADGAEVFEGWSAQGNETIRNLLLDDSVETYLKEVIIVGMDFTDQAGREMLQSIAEGTDEDLAFQAEKVLRRIGK